MSDSDDSALIPGELDRALTNAFAEAVGSVDRLRSTLRRHVRAERSRGATLAEIDRGLELVINRIEEKAAFSGDSAPDGDLTAQIMRWSKSFFNGTGG